MSGYHGHGWFRDEYGTWQPDHDTDFRETWHFPPTFTSAQPQHAGYEYRYRPDPVTANACVPGAARSIEPDVLRYVTQWGLTSEQADWLRTEAHRAVVFFGVARTRILLANRDPDYLRLYSTVLVDAPPPVKIRTQPKPKRAAPEPAERVPAYLGGQINPAWRAPGKQGGHILPAGEPLPADWAPVAGGTR